MPDPIPSEHDDRLLAVGRDAQVDTDYRVVAARNLLHVLAVLA